jgi:hypothetical protein
MRLNGLRFFSCWTNQVVNNARARRQTYPSDKMRVRRSLMGRRAAPSHYLAARVFTFSTILLRQRIVIGQ